MYEDIECLVCGYRWMRGTIQYQEDDGTALEIANLICSVCGSDIIKIHEGIASNWTMTGTDNNKAIL